MCTEICSIEYCSTFSIPITSLDIVVNLNFVSRKNYQSRKKIPFIKGGRQIKQNLLVHGIIRFIKMKNKTYTTTNLSCDFLT